MNHKVNLRFSDFDLIYEMIYNSFKLNITMQDKVLWMISDVKYSG